MKTEKDNSSILYLMLGFLTVAAYVVILSFSASEDWFWSDDQLQLSFVRNMATPRHLFGPDSFNLFRPVKNIVWFLFSHIVVDHGVATCRLVATAFGVCSFFPVLLLCNRVLGSQWKGLTASAVWLLSPTLVSSVAWLSALNIQIMVGFGAAAIVIHDSAWTVEHRTSQARIGLAGAFLFLALASYECAVSFFPILILFDFFLRNQRIKLRSARLSHLYYFLIVVLYAILRIYSSSRTSIQNSWIEGTRWQLIVSSPWFVIQHFISWFWPFGRFTVLSSYQWGDVSLWSLVLCWVALILLSVQLLFIRKRQPVLFFCVLFAFVGIAPVSNCLGFGNGPYGDYYLTLSSIGLACTATEGCCLLVRDARDGHALRYLSLAAIALFSSIRLGAAFEACRWSYYWGRSELAFEESIRCFPSFVSNKLAFAEYLADEDRFMDAFVLCDQIENQSRFFSSSPGARVVYLVKALNELKVHRNADKALFFLVRIAQSAGSFVSNQMIEYYRGCVFEDILGDEARAEAQYEKALSAEWDISLVSCADRLARLKAIHGKQEDAIRMWERARNLDPGNITLLWNLGIAYREIGDTNNADEIQKLVNKLAGVPLSQ